VLFRDQHCCLLRAGHPALQHGKSVQPRAAAHASSAWKRMQRCRTWWFHHWAQASQIENVTLHNINITGSNIGVVNTGTIQTVDGAVGVLQSRHDDQLAMALKALTEATANSTALAAVDKQRVLENLSVVSTEAVAPEPQRRKIMVRTLLADSGTVLGVAADVATVWAQWGHVVTAFFV
jgi:hypothetical protein